MRLRKKSKKFLAYLIPVILVAGTTLGAGVWLLSVDVPIEYDEPYTISMSQSETDGYEWEPLRFRETTTTQTAYFNETGAGISYHQYVRVDNPADTDPVNVNFTVNEPDGFDDQMGFTLDYNGIVEPGEEGELTVDNWGQTQGTIVVDPGEAREITVVYTLNNSVPTSNGHDVIWDFYEVDDEQVTTAGADLQEWTGPTEEIDVVVSTEDELRENVSDGETEVIGIDSDIALTENNPISVEDEGEIIVSASNTRQLVENNTEEVSSIFDIKADGVTIEGLRITNSEEYGNKGIRLRDSRSDVVIDNNVITNCWEPIIFNSATTSHENITISNNELAGDFIGIMAFTVNNSTIRNNYIHDIDVGIQMSIYTNEAHQTPSHNVIENNTFEDLVEAGNEPDDDMWYYGILLQGKDTTVRYNEFVGGGEFGVLVTDSISPYVDEDRDISGNEINYNNIYGHSRAGVAETEDYYDDLSPSGYTVDATNNWWGTDVESEIEEMTLNDVTYTPYQDYPIPEE